MGRWEPDSAGRLVQAALVLFGERGFDQTTTEEIAKQAGLTERTFFRYFADKREVLFFGANELQENLVRLVAEAPESAPPMEAVIQALEAVGSELQERRQFARQRHAVIAANPELLERELVKLASIAAALARTLSGRGVSDVAATVAAEAGMAVFRIAFDRWVAGPDEHDLPSVIRTSLQDLRTVTTEKPRRARRSPIPA